MSAVVEWSAPMTLTSPAGTLLFNQRDESGRMYWLDPDACQSGQDIVVKRDRISGADGSILSRRFKAGYELRMAFWMFDGGGFAIGQTLVEMWDELLRHLDALWNPSLADQVSNCRLQWVPSGSPISEITDEPIAWMLDRARTLELPNPQGLYPKKGTFALDTEYPYVLRADQFTTSLTSGVPATLDHSDGTTNTFGVIRVDGPVSTFTLQNDTALDPNGNPLKIVYDDSLPGPPPAIGTGDYVEITCFRETVVLNGSEDFGSIAGIDIPVSDLRLPIVPGLNTVTLTGADGEILWNAARA